MPAVILAASCGLLVTVIFFYIYCQYHEHVLKIWTITALGFALGPILTLLSVTILPRESYIGLLGEEFVYLFSGTLLIKGIYVILHKKFSKWVICGNLIGGLWIILAYLMKLPFLYHAIPASILISRLFFRGGLVLFQSYQLTGTGGIVAGWSLVIGGVNFLVSPFIRENPALSSGAYLLAAIYTVAIGVGVLLLYFEKVRRDLSESEARYRFMAENARDIVYHLRISPQLKFEFVSSAASQISGYTPEEYYHDPEILIKTVHPDYQNILEQIVAGVYDYQKPVTLPWFNKSGHLYWLEQHIHPVTDSEGKVYALEGIARNVTERVEMEEQLKILSMRDPVTGLYNRTFFEQACRTFDNENFNPLGIILCDIDGLKLINDTMGHEIGDWLLLAASWVIQESFRENEVIARIGGDEFAVLLLKTSAAMMETSIKRIESAIQVYNNYDVGVHLSMSIGFAIRNDSNIKITELFKNADNNMNREKLYRSQSARSTIVNTLRKALEARDFITEGHTERLQDSVIKLAMAIGFTEVRLTDLKLLAQFHDIGKVGIPDRILFKPGKLTPEEMLEMQRHSEIGYRIAQSSPDLVPIADWILRHHEWWNGRGYPLRLKGEEIPLECRILAIVDAYDAMINDRPYRKALTEEEAIAELMKGAGVQFDPWLVEEFIKIQ